jgi:hypothetical protein
MISLLLAQVVLNSYFQRPVVSVGAGGSILQEDGVSAILQEDGVSLVMQEFTAGGALLQQDGFFIFQQDGTSKITQEE